MSAPDDRDRAVALLGRYFELVPDWTLVEEVAAAFEEVRAAERERVAAPVRALADELDTEADVLNVLGEGNARISRLIDLAARLRAVLPPQPEEPQP